MADVNIKEEKIIYDGHGKLTETTYAIKKKNGDWEEQTRILFDHGNAATILLYNTEKNTVILITQFRLASFVNGNHNGILLETCAGLLEENEKPEDAVIREIKEETGYEIKDVQKIGEAYSSPGAYTELVHYFIAPYRDEQKKASGGGLEDEGEEVKVLEIPFEEAMRQAENGKIKDSKTLLMLYYVKSKGLLT